MSEVGAAQKVVTKYGVSSILSAMRRHKEEKEVQLYALKALNGLCEVREVSEAVGREGGIPAVVEVWRLFAEEEEMVKLGASVLKMVTRVSEATADELIACNAVQTMLEVLEQYASEALVMAALCELVAVMATNAQAKKRFLDEDVVSTLVVMITTGGKEDAEMIGSALHALMSLLAPPFDGDALQGQDIVAIIVDAFLVVLDSDAVNVDEACLNCMGALRAIAEDEDRKRELIAGDGKEVLEKVLSRTARDQELSTAALEVLEELCDERDARNEIADEDMVSAVVEVMKHYPFSPVVQRKGAQLAGGRGRGGLHARGLLRRGDGEGRDQRHAQLHVRPRGGRQRLPVPGELLGRGRRCGRGEQGEGGPAGAGDQRQERQREDGRGGDGAEEGAGDEGEDAPPPPSPPRRGRGRSEAPPPPSPPPSRREA